ncbi:hypothetical protein FNYG_15961 [Fusarium nygamai]|uniref:Uncharacterized protein n=1 Tax=Gibberella nygamai TaxID=42673 RepID=A0A2K0TY18_GIBNY|nr:hypothetical protein FNYG_15961 [Fusarium nygamai]
MIADSRRLVEAGCVQWQACSETNKTKEAAGQGEAVQGHEASTEGDLSRNNGLSPSGRLPAGSWILKIGNAHVKVACPMKQDGKRDRIGWWPTQSRLVLKL